MSEENIELFEQFIAENKYDCAELLLNELLDIPSNRPNQALRDKLINFAVKNQSIDALKLAYHHYFHHGAEQHLQNIRVDIAFEILNEKVYDFIAPCLLASLTNMENITYSMINYRDVDVAQYIINSSTLELDKLCLIKTIRNLFDEREGIELLKIIPNTIHFNPLQIYQCFQVAFESSCIAGLNYLIDNFETLSIELLATITDKKSDTYQKTADFMSSIQCRYETPEFLTHALQLIRKHCPVENETDLSQKFLLAFIRHKKYLPKEAIGEFVLANFSFDKIDSIIEFLKHEEQNDLAQTVEINYEKAKLETTVDKIETGKGKALKV